MQKVTTGFAELNGTQFYYELAGEGEPLVLIHAGICDCRMWDDQFEALAEHYRVLRYDWRGAGKTAVVDLPYAHHDDLQALLQHLDIPKAHLLGCSMGGAIAVDFTLTYPKRVASLIIVNSAPRGLEIEDEFIPEQWDEIKAAQAAEDWERLAELEVQVWVDGPQRSPDQVDGRIRDKVRAMNRIILQNEALDLGQETAVAPPASQRLADIGVPTLIISSDLDDPDMKKAADVMAAQIPGCQKVTFPNTAHLPNMEKPTKFNQIVLEFLAKKEA